MAGLLRPTDTGSLQFKLETTFLPSVDAPFSIYIFITALKETCRKVAKKIHSSH